jgi:transposase-like protein
VRYRPRFCPHADCPAHRDEPLRHRLHGRYRRRCDGRLVQRFRCLACRRTFSVQSFRLDYRLKNPRLHLTLLGLFASKVTHRQSARILRCTRRTVARRLDLLGRHCEAFHRRMLERARKRGGLSGTFQLDELETFEHNRRLAPVTMPVLIGRRSYFVVDLETAALPCRGGLSEALRQEKQRRERTQGKRRSGSRAAVGACVRTLARARGPRGAVLVLTDRKASYPSILRKELGSRYAHVRVHSKRRRDYKNPLFPINHTLAMARDGISRLVRRNWGASKLRAWLERHAWVWAAWRNYVRGITNQAPRVTPAMAAGVARRRWSVAQMCAWRLHK